MNKNKRIQGWTDIPMNKTGIREAEHLAEKVRTIPVDAIYSSPLQRAYQTAEIISRYHKKSIISVDALKEAGFGVFEGLKWEELMSHPLITGRHEGNDRFHDRTGEGESIHDVYLRTSSAIDDLVHKHQNESILIVSHGLAIKTIAYHAGIVSRDQIEQIEIKNAQLYHLDYNHGTGNYGIIDFPITWRI